MAAQATAALDFSPCLTHKVKETSDRGENLGPTGNEVCFCDALAQNDSAHRCWVMTS